MKYNDQIHDLLVTIQNENRFHNKGVLRRLDDIERLIINMTIDDSIVQQLVDAINTALMAEAGDATAEAAKDATIASLTAQLAPNPTLLASVQDVLAKALVANPPPVVVPPPAPVTPDVPATPAA